MVQNMERLCCFYYDRGKNETCICIVREKEQITIMSTNWIWTNDWKPEDKEAPALVLFRKKFYLERRPEHARILISADSRYKLYVNGKMAEMGPSRGDRQVWFYDQVDLAPYLQEGENVLAVRVLRYPMIHSRGNHGIFRTEFPGLYVCGTEEEKGRISMAQSLDADSSWKTMTDRGFRIVSEAEGFAPLQIYEEVHGDSSLKGWMMPGYDDGGWQSAYEYPDMDRAVSPGNLLPRNIPYLYRKDRRFEKVKKARNTDIPEETWDLWIQGKCQVVVPAHTEQEVELSAGEEMTGYLHLEIAGGKGAVITLLQSEAYVQDGRRNGLPVKGDREDHINGHLEGYTDRYICAGYGTGEMPEVYEPFWFRTFRFVRLTVRAGEEPLTLLGFDYTETGYPLEVKTEVSTSDPSMEKIWEISERTLRRCMHETYEDCPFYEQLQYAMDSRSQILYTYSVAADDRLARKCMDDFRRSQRYDGLLNCSYPCYGANVIPGFSIYYILMLHDHMMYFGDRELLEDHMPAVEGILRFFHKNLTEEGYVAKIGGLNGQDRYWSFIDWTPEWDETTGVPAATRKGAVTMESLLYIMGLQHVAKIAEYLGREEAAARYRERAAEVQDAVRRCCTGVNGMLQDGPGVEEYSQHVQVFAVLTDTVDPETGKRNLLETVLHKEAYAQCSVAMAFYLFRALQKTGMYERTKEYWGLWEQMIEQNATTCVEDGVGQRSDCHAWGSLLLYELPSVILGVRSAKPGYEEIEIHPEPGFLEYARGSVVTPKGKVSVRWEKKDGLNIEYEAPEGISVRE